MPRRLKFLLNVSVKARSDPMFVRGQQATQKQRQGKALYDTRSHGSDDRTGTELEATRADVRIRIHTLISHSHRKIKVVVVVIS
jgi:hypothetical protein